MSLLLQAPLEREGPFGEMFGYLGPEMEDVFTMNVIRVTHRCNPWIMNSYTCMHRGIFTAPIESLYDHLLRRLVPNLVGLPYPQNMMGGALLNDWPRV